MNNTIILIFLGFNILKYIKDYKYIYNRFLLERYLGSFDYKRIINNSVDIGDLRLESLHFFKNNNKYNHEKNILAKRFDIK